MKPLVVTGRVLTISESTKRRNPELNRDSLGPVVPSERQRRSEAPLVEKLPRRRSRKGRVQIIVTLIDCRKGLADSDNSAFGHKPTRDEIAKHLGIDDGDPRIRWEYDRCETLGAEGTIVKLERI